MNALLAPCLQGQHAAGELVFGYLQHHGYWDSAAAVARDVLGGAVAVSPQDVQDMQVGCCAEAADGWLPMAGCPLLALLCCVVPWWLASVCGQQLWLLMVPSAASPPLAPTPPPSHRPLFAAAAAHQRAGAGR
jgi:hypothetical protein